MKKGNPEPDSQARVFSSVGVGVGNSHRTNKRSAVSTCPRCSSLDVF